MGLMKLLGALIMSSVLRIAPVSNALSGHWLTLFLHSHLLKLVGVRGVSGEFAHCALAEIAFAEPVDLIQIMLAKGASDPVTVSVCWPIKSINCGNHLLALTSGVVMT